MKLKYHLAILSVLLLAGFSSARAEECSSSARVDEAGKRFSVVTNKVSGMEAQSFSDIGCAVVSRNGECATRQGMFDDNAVVYDYASGEQVRADNAYFVLTTGVPTPQGYGIVAFKNKAEAEEFSAAHGKGKVVKWFELVDEKLK
jgi:hypothetical protein